MKNFGAILFFFIFFSASAQNNETIEFIEDDGLVNVVEDSLVTKKSPWSSSVAIGASVGIGSGNSTMLSTYINPRINYQLTPRFQVSMGLMAVRSHFDNYTYYNFYESQTQVINANTNSAYFTLQGAYLLSENIKVYGGIMIGAQRMDMPNANFIENTPKAYQLGLEYKIGKHTAIQLEIQYHENNNPYHNNTPWGFQNNQDFNHPFYRGM
ncbi:MAG: outer membrane beta-barrel protein [Bacteroidales bacterium]|nr:outer membrane beta-barrel protein [Bacteroidales bacterium]